MYELNVLYAPTHHINLCLVSIYSSLSVFSLTLYTPLSPFLFHSPSPLPSLPDSLFKIVPMHRYSAQEQFRKATATARSMPDVVILQKLQVVHHLIVLGAILYKLRRFMKNNGSNRW